MAKKGRKFTEKRTVYEAKLSEMVRRVNNEIKNSNGTSTSKQQ